MTDQPRTPGLAAALAALQAELPPVAKTKTAEVKNSDNKFLYSYKYADLADVTAAIMPLMGRHGLAFTCQPTLRDDGKFGLAYQLLHESGELIDGWYPIDERLKIQQVGGSITYARRYVLCALTGVAAEEDTDGQHLDAPADTRSQPRGKPPTRAAANLPKNRDGSTSRSRTTDDELAATGQMTDAQLRDHNRLERETKGTGPQGAERLDKTPDDDPFYTAPLRTPQPAADKAKAIIMHFNRLEVADRDERLANTATIVGRDITSTNDLTAAEGIAVTEFLGKCRDNPALQLALNEKASYDRRYNKMAGIDG